MAKSVQMMRCAWRASFANLTDVMWWAILSADEQDVPDAAVTDAERGAALFRYADRYLRRYGARP